MEHDMSVGESTEGTAAPSGLLGGVYEIGIGVMDIGEALSFWRAAGYEVRGDGALDQGQAEALYGVPSALKSVSLKHQAAHAGLVRLMQWDRPIGTGLNMAPLKTVGNRWSVHRTEDLDNIRLHAEVFKRQGMDIRFEVSGFHLNLGKPLEQKQPFREPMAGAYDIMMFMPEAQYIAMRRINFDMAKYGTPNPNSLMRASEGCHMALVAQGDDPSIFDFYSNVIGFKPGRRTHVDYRPGYMPSDFMSLEEGEHFVEVNFDDPQSGNAPSEQLPGRLRCFLLQPREPLPDRKSDAQPGCLGYSLYTIRCQDISRMHARVTRSTASKVTDVTVDEFGCSAFAFKAPDGFTWLALATG